jgi:hypothetical protein
MNRDEPGRCNQAEARTHDDPALADAGKRHVEEFVVAVGRACDQLAGSSDHIEFEHVIDLRSVPIRRFANSPNAKRAAHGKHHRVGHDRRCEVLLEGHFCHVAPQRTGLSLDGVAAVPAHAVQRARVDDHPARCL